ncbi:hypothetical protein NDU88_007800 [Pleurodeles waltl]|uniref:Uncharacterized protein n=1 Tax=Pleurodeles waltl TaxID=8319 RepID=A0AAV7QQZ5_PLEWA|nr:hypothetical protein NDU88_007800 [Pleurodeles waltl]
MARFLTRILSGIPSTFPSEWKSCEQCGSVREPEPVVCAKGCEMRRGPEEGVGRDERRPGKVCAAYEAVRI